MDFTTWTQIAFQVGWLKDTLKILYCIGTKTLISYLYFSSLILFLTFIPLFLLFCYLLLDKKATAKRQGLVNFNLLNQVLRSEIFLNQDGELQAVHVILGFKPITTHFQVSKHVIKAKDQRLTLVDVVVEWFIRKPPFTGTQLVELPILTET